MSEYVIVIERGGDGSFSAYVPDLPGCVSCGDTLEELQVNVRAAVQLHIKSLREYGEPVPPPTATVDRVVAA